MTDDCIDIIGTLIERRLELGITQKELAEAIGAKQPAIARFEQKKIIPRYDLVAKIARALNCRITVEKI